MIHSFHQVAIFLAGELGAAPFIVKDEWFIMLFVFTVVHVAFHALFTLLRCWAQKRDKVRRKKCTCTTLYSPYLWHSSTKSFGSRIYPCSSRH